MPGFVRDDENTGKLATMNSEPGQPTRLAVLFVGGEILMFETCLMFRFMGDFLVLGIAHKSGRQISPAD